MGIPLYLAMTAQDFQSCSCLPHPIAWLSCLFSPFGRGLISLPDQLPKDSLLILTDRIPFWNHDSALIAQTLQRTVEEFSCCGILLDFQRPGYHLKEVIRCVAALPCPVCVSSLYDPGDRAVLVPSPPLDVPLAEYLLPWKGREIWLEASLGNETITVTEAGSQRKAADDDAAVADRFHDGQLHCHYDIRLGENAQFRLSRTKEDLSELLAEGEPLGVTRAVGLYQELKKTAPELPERSHTSMQEGD